MAAMAKRNLAEVILYWPPPLRPRARADAKPTLVRSETSSSSTSASAAKMPNTSLPSGVAVLIDAPCPVSTWKPTPLAVRSCTVLIRWRRLRPRRSSFHTRSRSPFRNAFRQAVKAGARVEASGRQVFIDVLGIDAGGLQRIALQIQNLGAIRLGNAHIA